MSDETIVPFQHPSPSQGRGTYAVAHERWAETVSAADQEWIKRMIPAEVPVALVYNGLSHVVMMMTPADLHDFAVGFSLTEGIIESIDECLEVSIQRADEGIVLNVTIPESRYQTLRTRRRNLVGQTGCGVCGFIELENVVRPLPQIDVKPRLTFQAARDALQDLPTWQKLNARSGGVHAAAFAAWDGAIVDAREDVGRHNAFDKLIGALALQGIDSASGFAVLSSRCSYELVTKALAARMSTLVTISAPTELAIRIAAEHQLTLVAQAREESMLCFHDPFHLFDGLG